MNFWKDKPVVVRNEKVKVRQILSTTELLNNIEIDINIAKKWSKLEWKIIDLSQVECKKSMLEFVNNNYENPGTKTTLDYSLDLFDYFCQKNTLAIAFYPVGKSYQVGFITGVKKQIKVKSEESKILTALEVNFLCLLPELRNMHLSSYMISILSRESLLQFPDISGAIYTVGQKLQIQPFSLKVYYHRPINIDNMYNVGLLDKYYMSEIPKCIYSSFNYNYELTQLKTLEYIDKKEFKLGIYKDERDNIESKLNEWLDSKMNIYEIRENLWEILEGDAFEIFIIRNQKTNDITDFVVMYKMNSVLKSDKTISCKNGYLYMYFFESESRDDCIDILEWIGSLCKEKNILDSMIIMQPFEGSNNQYIRRKYLLGTGFLNYYFYNIELYNITPFTNGLVTI